MKVLIYGNGWIGTMFKKLLESNNINYIVGVSRVDNIIDVTNEINSINPTHIASFIGRTHGKIGNKIFTTIDYLEMEGKLVENIRDNLYSPLILADICRDKNIHFTYLGTGCIFKFDNDHPFGMEMNGFTEGSKPNFFGSSYSIVKGFTDRIISQYNNVLNLRIRMPITGEINSRNFITKIANYKKICSVPNSMTVLPELLPIVLDMMKNKTCGTINLTNPGLISHNEILEMYKLIIDNNFTWNNFSCEEQRSILAAERSNNYLDTSKLETLYPHVRSIKDAVKDCLYKYKQNIIENLQTSEIVSCNTLSLCDKDSGNTRLHAIVDSGNTLSQSDKDSCNTLSLCDKDSCNISQYMNNILITGGCGFIGSNFINNYFPKKKFNTLINLDKMYYCADETNINNNIRNDNSYKFIKGDLCDMKLMQDILSTYNITHIIHFAAQSHVQNSFEDSIKFTYDNILGTHTLLEACRKYNKIEKFIHVSTDEVYGESMNTINEMHKTEHSILCPTNPYAATKAGAELIAQSYNHSYKMPIIITRGNNVYGRNQYPEKLIPLFIKLLKENKKVTIQGNGSSVRAFLHVSDTSNAFEIILEKGQVGEIYNIGCDENMEYSVMDIAKILIGIIKKTDNYEKWIEYIEDRPFNDMRYYISNIKLKNLGWTINTNLLDGLNELV